MPTINPTLPSDGDDIDAADVNDPLNAILNLVNGNLDQDNIDAAADLNVNSVTTTNDVTVGGDVAVTGGITATSLTLAGTATAEGWSPLGATPNTVTANGNNSFDLVFNSTDLTDTLTNGMRVRATRTVAAPNTAFSLDGTNDYYVKTSPNKLTFTDDFVCSAWVYLTSYADAAIVSRYNGTSGFRFFMASSGRVYLQGTNAGVTNYRRVSSYQSLPLNRWVHVSAQLDMSTYTATTTTCCVMFDGVDVPAALETSGTNPTALVQAGNLEVGSENGGTLPFPGYLDQVAIYNAKVTQATILASINRALTGSETSLASAYSNGSVNDLNTTTPNNLTATNGATTVANSPFGNRGVSTTLEYGIVMANAFSTNTTVTIQVPEGCQLPTTGGITSVDYSTQSIPYGFPRSKNRWTLVYHNKLIASQSSPTVNVWYNLSSAQLKVPTGAWTTKYSGSGFVGNGSSPCSMHATLHTANNAEDPVMTHRFIYSGAVGNVMGNAYREGFAVTTTQTPYYLNAKSDQAGVTLLQWAPSSEITIIEAINAYL